MSSLFDDLPSPSKAKESTTPTCVPAKAAAVDAKPALKKRREEKGGGGAGEDAKRQRKGAVRFGDEAGLTGVTASDALKRIEKHIGQPTKCYKSKSCTKEEEEEENATKANLLFPSSWLASLV